MGFPGVGVLLEVAEAPEEAQRGSGAVEGGGNARAQRPNRGDSNRREGRGRGGEHRHEGGVGKPTEWFVEAKELRHGPTT